MTVWACKAERYPKSRWTLRVAPSTRVFNACGISFQIRYTRENSGIGMSWVMCIHKFGSSNLLYRGHDLLSILSTGGNCEPMHCTFASYSRMHVHTPNKLLPNMPLTIREHWALLPCRIRSHRLRSKRPLMFSVQIARCRRLEGRRTGGEPVHGSCPPGFFNASRISHSVPNLILMHQGGFSRERFSGTCQVHDIG